MQTHSQRSGNLSLPLPPKPVKSPSRHRAVIDDRPIHNHPFKLVHTHPPHHQVALLCIRIRLSHRQPLGQKHMVLLIHHPICNLQRRQQRHSLRRQPRLLLQLSAGHLLRHHLRLLPPALRKLQVPSTNGIPKLLDQINKLPIRSHVQRNNNRGRIFIDHSIDPAHPIRPFDNVLTNTCPRVPVNLPAADRLDRHNSPVERLTLEPKTPNATDIFPTHRLSASLPYTHSPEPS